MQLDYLYGRLVESVKEGGPEDATWHVCLEGGAYIYIFDAGYVMPDEEQLVGMSFNTVNQGPSPQLVFGTDKVPMATVVNLPAEGYGISDATLTKGQIVRPWQSVEEQQLPPDPEEERVEEAGREEFQAQADDTERAQAFEERNG